MIDIITQSLNDLRWNKSWNRYGRKKLDLADGGEDEPDRYYFITGLIRDWSRCAYNNYTPSLKISKASYLEKHHMLMGLAAMLIKEYDPAFTYTSIQFSKCVKTPKHRDRNNIGNSVIVGFGDYTGGSLIIYDEQGNEHAHDIYHKPLVFNANQEYHRTQDFKGTRFTITWFTIKDFN
tara:strand:+ start:40 stop:573 length:534 start_codon:yes stop_codon:yes gene_type:complete